MVMFAFAVSAAAFSPNNQAQLGACVASDQRTDCGHFGTGQQQCEQSGCCWGPVTPNPDNKPWCYKQNGPGPAPGPGPSPGPAPGPSGCPLAYTSKGAPFSEAEVKKMRGYFEKNIDIEGKGGVVAAPDHNTGPGGSYYYHWERDGALSMEALQKTASSFSEVKEKMAHYAGWVKGRQQEKTPNQGMTTVLTEPKYMLPNGEVFTDPWCRPQNDGPGLRAKTLIGYAEALALEEQQAQLPHTATARTMDTLTVHTASSKQTTLLVFHTTTTSLTSTTAHIQPSTLTMTTWSLLATHTQPTLATHQDQECSPTKAATDPLMAELRAWDKHSTDHKGHQLVTHTNTDTGITLSPATTEQDQAATLQPQATTALMAQAILPHTPRDTEQAAAA